MAVDFENMMDTNPLANSIPWPKDLRVTGTHYGKPFTGTVDSEHSRFCSSTFIYRVVLDEPMGQFLLVSLDVYSSSTNDTLKWVNA